jgi:hypothetical protein
VSAPGDKVFIVSFRAGRLLLGGAMIVGRLTSQRRAELVRGEQLWRASDHVLARPPFETLRHDLEMSESVVRQLRFLPDLRPPVFTHNDQLDSQTLRGLRELTSDAAALLDGFLVTPSRRMRRGVPHGITATHINTAIKLIDRGDLEDRFGPSTGYDLLHRGKRYPPKRVIGLAAREVTGEMLDPGAFTGGERSRCHRILEDAGFIIVPKGDGTFDRELEDDAAQQEIEARQDLAPTERSQLINARRGQGRFRRAVGEIEKRCRVTGVQSAAHLRASHIKPWSRSTDEEKMDGANGLLLAPHIDHLFDQGFISFSDDGLLLCATCMDSKVLAAWSVRPDLEVGPFIERQRAYLQYHRKNIFKGRMR